MSAGVRHLYVHLPFCAHRCGYCDFVTVALPRKVLRTSRGPREVGRSGQHDAYVAALLAELDLEREALAPEPETVYLGGGTPTFTEPAALARLLSSLPPAAEVTVEANPETVTPGLAVLLVEQGVTRVSLGVQSFQPELLRVLERRAQPQDVRRAVAILREAGLDNLSLDLLYGVPGQTPADLARDLEEALRLEPEHLSCYELEAKPGTRFTHAHGAELERQAEAMEGYFEQVVDALTAAGYRWYETANFCRPGRESRHNLAYWLGRDYLGIGVGAVSTVGGLRRRNTPRLPVYVRALRAGTEPPRELEPLSEETRLRERLLLGLRLDRPVDLAEVAPAIDGAALERVERLGLARRSHEGLSLTRRGRFLGGAVTAELLAYH